MGNMMKYLENILGIKTNIEPWHGAAKLPYFLSDGYTFTKTTLAGVPCLFMKPKDELGTLTAVKKHLTKVREIEPLPVVLELDGMTARRRKSLIDARIPFVAPDIQIYLPFLGVALTERYTSEKPPKTTLMPSSQLLLFYYLYGGEPELYTNGVAEKLGLSAMQITRAVQQLKVLGLMSVKKDGVRTVISNTADRRALFEAAKPHLMNPVRKRIYAELNATPAGLPLSGLSALAELSMLNPPEVKTFACFGEPAGLSGTDTLIDSDKQAAVEIWRYDPALLSGHAGVADPLSLTVSLSPDGDERIEQAVDELLSNLWR